MTYYCNAISKQEYLTFPPLRLSLSKAWYACSHPVIGWGLPAGSALLFSWSLLNIARQAVEHMKCFCCYGQWRKWQWIWKCADDSTWNSTSSEFRGGCFHQIPHPLPDSFTGFPHAVGRDFSSEMMWNYIVQGNGYNVCLRPARQAVFFKQRWISFFKSSHQTSAQCGNT